jgi:hypothetical protein
MFEFSYNVGMKLSQEIQREYDRLTQLIATIRASSRNLKIIEGPGGKISLTDLIAYQIGWGRCVIRWYETGIKGEMPEMPGEGFSSWNYTGIARHFYEKYHNDQDRVFHEVVLKLVEIVEKEHQKGNLEKLGIWPWCTLQSDKQWPLSKWIRVNTCAPYKRAHALIKKSNLT